MPAPWSPLRRPGSLSENRRPGGIDVVVDVIRAVGHIGLYPFGLERLGNEDGSLGGGNEEYEREAGVPIRVVDALELDTQLTSDAGDAVPEFSLAPSHVAQYLVQSAELDEGHGALQLRHAEVNTGQNLFSRDLVAVPTDHVVIHQDPAHDAIVVGQIGRASCRERV